MKRTLLLILIGLLAINNGWCEVNYDFSAVAPSGQTLYYKICSYNVAAVVAPDRVNTGLYDQNYYYSWNNYNKPTGDLSIPLEVTNGNVTYSVRYIYSQAFAGCNGLTAVTIPNSVKLIYGYAFDGCSGLSLINIPDGVTQIGESAFRDCSNLTSVTIGSSITYIGITAFKNCSSLNSIQFNAKNCTYGGQNSSPFYGCDNITFFSFGDSVRTIPAFICYGLNGLTSITIGGSVDTIKNEAFYNCDHLTNIIFGASVAYIGNNAFAYCSNITNMHLRGSIPPTIQNNTFLLVPTNPDHHVYVPCNSASAYQNAAYWNLFSIEEEFPYSFSVTSSDITRGTVQVLHAPECNNLQAEVQANSYNGYHFVQWNDGDTNAHRYMVVVQDTAIQAEFSEGNIGVKDIISNETKIYVVDGRIVVDGLFDDNVRIFDMIGREIHNEKLSKGVYLVKIGNYPARRVVVIR